MSHPKRRWLRVVGLALALLVAATWTLASADIEALTADVTFLSSDALDGRVAATFGQDPAGSLSAQSYIKMRLSQAGYGGRITTQAIGAGGTNILAWVDGAGPLTNEYVLVGAHYDHVPFPDLLQRCTQRGDDSVCNGATDNATGVALLLDIAEHFAQAAPSPRRKVYFLFWDREELDLGGSVKYRNSTVPPWPQPVAYVNYDIQGANLLPSLRDTTFAIGASSGGSRLRSAVTNAAAPEAGQLRMRQLGEALGTYRSDYATFVAPAVVRKENPFLAPNLPRVPTVYFSDSSGPCYHTTQDDVSVVDLQKLERQAKIGLRLVQDLATGEKPTIQPLPAGAQEFGARVGAFMGWSPPFPAIPPPTFEDAVELLDVADRARCDAALPEQLRAQIEAERLKLQAIVSAGEAAYRPVDDGETVARAIMAATAALASADCSGFLDGGASACPP